MRPLTTWLFTGSLLAVLLGSALTGAIKPLRVVAGVDEKFSLDIVVENVEGLHAWQVMLEYDPEILGVAEVEHGNFLRSGGETVPLQVLQRGKVLLGECLYGAQKVSGSGVLARITFVACDEGTSGLNLVDTLLLNEQQESLSHQTVGGSFETPDVSSSASQEKQVESEATEEQASETKPAVQGTNSVALPIEVVGEEDVQMDQHEQEAQPVSQEESQTTNDQAARELPVQVEQEGDDVISGIPVVYLTTTGGV
jgi:hypothetical protein